MSIPGRDWLQGVIKNCDQMYFKQSEYQDLTLDETLLNTLRSALKAGVLDKTQGPQMIKDIDKALKDLKGRKIGELSSKDKKHVLSVFQKAVKGTLPHISEADDAESGYGDSEAVDLQQLRQAAQLSEQDLGKILERQKALKELFKKELASKKIEDMEGNKVPLKKLKENEYQLTLPLIEEITTLTAEDIGEGQKYPDTFLADHLDQQRAKHFTLTMVEPSKARKVIVRTRQDAEQLIARAQALAHTFASHPEKAGKMTKAILLFTTQYMGNWLLTPLLNVLKMKQLQGYHDFFTDTHQVNIRIEPLMKNKILLKDQFQVSVEAQVYVLNESLAHEDKEVKECRQRLGVTPVVEGIVKVNFVCAMDAQGQFQIKNLKMDNFLNVL